MEEILHQLVDALSSYNPIIDSVSKLPIVTNWCGISSTHRMTVASFPLGYPLSLLAWSVFSIEVKGKLVN
jgi:hypothetical protein